LVGSDGCEVRLCGPSAFVRPRVPCTLTRQSRQPVLRHCYCPLRIHTPYRTPNETRSMRALAALRMVWASACVPCVSRLPPVSFYR
jgi:hypothetical protein